MPKIIRLVNLSVNEITFIPVCRDGYTRWASDLSRELVAVKAAFQGYNFVEGEDYVVDPKNYYIKFTGKSLVVRALYLIPNDQIDLDSYSNLKAYNNARLMYPTYLKGKECFFTDIKFVEEAFNEFYLHIKTEVNKIHNKEATQTSVMQQLNKDLLLIDGMTTQAYVTKPKSHFALAALTKAYLDEKATPTLVKTGFSLFKKDSILLPQYKGIFDPICLLQGHDFDKLLADMTNEYNTLIAPKYLQSATATAAAPLDVKQAVAKK